MTNVKTYTYGQLSQCAQTDAMYAMSNWDPFTPAPAFVLLAIQRRKRFLRDGTPVFRGFRLTQVR